MNADTAQNKMKRAAVSVSGIVQGVGFRPFLHRTARACGVCGWVRNTSLGVELEIEGAEAAVDDFLHRLQTEPPPLAVIADVQVVPQQKLAGYRGFEIRRSREGEHDTLVSPDVGTCPDCLRELRDPKNRRYRYPFINCTNCGPRFTITKTVPYDRRNTTMAPFDMCPACAAEYADIEDRRYHAQPDCCPVCGPRLWFADAAGKEQPGDAFLQAHKLLASGGILAVKGLGGFHLACIPQDAAVVEKLRRRKHRDEKPFALMCPDTGVVGAAIVASDGTSEPASRRRDPFLRRALMSMMGRDEINVAADAADLQVVDIVSGAAMLLPRPACHQLAAPRPKKSCRSLPVTPPSPPPSTR